MGRSESLDPGLRELLSRLRDRVRRYIVWDSLLAIAALVLVVFWIALAVDYLPVRIGGSEMPRSARAVVLVVVAILVAAILSKWLFGRLRRELPDDSLALLIERHHPSLGGRLVTAVQLTEQNRQHDSHSPVLLRRVHEEAAAAVDQVEFGRVFRWEPIRRKLMLVVPLLLAALVMAVASPQTFARAVGRLSLLSDSPWPRRASLEMIGIESPIITADETEEVTTELLTFEDKTLRLARGSSTTLRIRAATEELGHIVPDVCTVSYVDDAGNRGQSNLRRVGRVQDGYQSFVLDGPPLTSLAESVTMTIRGLDDRLLDYRIEAVDPPAIAEMELAIRYPNYLRIFDAGGADPDSEDQVLAYQAGFRIREGSSLTLRGTSSKPLGSVDVSTSSDQTVANLPSSEVVGDGTDREDESEPAMPSVRISKDRMSFEWSVNDLREPTSVRLVPRDETGISAQASYRYFIGVVRDQVPETTMSMKGIGSSITPIAMLPIQATAKDDYGVESLSLTMALRAASDRSDSDTTGDEEAAMKQHTVAPELDRDGNSQWTFDLRDLADDGTIPTPEPGASLQIFTTAKDRFDLAEPHVVRGEVVRLEVVTPETLLATLERRELEFRSRLEQAIDETRRLRQSLVAVQSDALNVLEEDAVAGDGGEADDASEDESLGGDEDELRARQRVQLRIRQAELQASKSTEELAGIVVGLEDLLLEMIQNRVDSVDRRERLETGVRDPLSAVVTEPLPRLKRQITSMERILMSEGESGDSAGSNGDSVADMTTAANDAIATTDEVLLSLSAVLEKMLDLESFNEILDLVRGLISDQEELIEETEETRNQQVQDLFK
ncbi:polyketide synthase [Rhodopirellula sp. JC740]|uniref:Polyketide synthase n=1 Tax=Rhodopirellula halodulae TaxID=2894198 RepID=A0ABS8NCZ6_9BACT|nr:polyketide synthase [Rhodopirellula sp. JC740]MCC9640708.1 polyketide synthase [Rhodopirellula sp. JC740]